MKAEVIGYVNSEEINQMSKEMSQTDLEKSFFEGPGKKIYKEKDEVNCHKVHVLFSFDEELVVISKSEYDRLQEESNWLGDLEAAGIDNTIAYEEACKIRRERLGDSDED